MSASFISIRTSVRLTLALAALGAVAAAIPAAACTVRLGAIDASVIAYDPFTTAATDGRIRLAAELADGDRCATTVALTDDSGAPLRTISFGGLVGFRPEVRADAGVRSIGDSSAAIELTVDRPRIVLEWLLVPLGDAVLAPGDYTILLQASAGVDGGDAAPVRGALTLRSIPRAQANLAGGAAGYDSGSDAVTIDLGELRTGATGHAFLQVRGNTAAHLTFRSMNDGRLVTAASPPAAISYGLAIAGIPVDLKTTATRTVDPPATLRGSAMDLTVTVGDVTGAAAGRYSDTIAIDISP